jgi:hypothetical protein
MEVIVLSISYFKFYLFYSLKEVITYNKTMSSLKFKFAD